MKKITNIILIACTCLIAPIIFMKVMPYQRSATKMRILTRQTQGPICDETLQNQNITSTKIKTSVVVFIPTPVEWSQRRLHVTKNFIDAKWPSCLVHYAYIFGTKSGPTLGQELNMSSIIEEKNKFKQFGNLHYVFTNCRDYGNEKNNANATSATTCKTYEGLKFADQNFDAEFVWRGADDAYLNLKFFFSQVAPFLRDPSLGPIYFGSMRFEPSASDLMLSSQPELQENVWRMHSFGAYMGGMGFMVSMDVARFVGSWKIPPHLTWCEDVMIGAWLMPFQIEWMDANMYGWNMHDRQNYIKSTCAKQLLVHYVQEDDWNHIDNSTGNMMFCS